MMLDLQRVEDEKLLQLPRLNPVAMIFDVLSDRELPQVVALAVVVFAPVVTFVLRCFGKATAAWWNWAMTAGSAHA